MTKARTLADMISDGVIGTTELADDVITPVKLDETGNYTMARLGVGASASTYGIEVLGTGSASSIRVGDTTNNVNVDVRANSTGALFRTASNHPVVFATNQTERMRIESSGIVGIGASTSLSRKLTVSDDVNPAGYTIDLRTSGAYNSGYQSGMVFSAPYTSGGAITDLASIQGGKENTTDGHYGGRLTFHTRLNGGTDAERMRIDSIGNVGIGVSPSYKLDVDVGAPSSSDQVLGRFSSQAGTRSIGYVWDDSASTLGISTLTNHAMTFHINGNSNEKMRIDTNGRVGIGTTVLNSNKVVIEGGNAGTHSSNLKLSTGNSANGLVSDLAFTGTFVTPTTDKGPRRTADITSGYITANWGNEYLAFGVGGATDSAYQTTTRMLIDGSGRVGIGNNSPTETLAIRTYGNSEISTQYGTGTKAKLSAYSNAAAVHLPSASVAFSVESETGAMDTLNLRSDYSGSTYKGLKMDTYGRVTKPYQPLCAFKSSIGTTNDQRFGVQNTILNQGSHLDTGSNSGRFTCPVAGNYKCTFTGYTNYTSGYGYVHLRKNGVTQAHAIHWNHNGNTIHTTVANTFIVNCAAGNYLEFWLLSANSRVQDANITFELIG